MWETYLQEKNNTVWKAKLRIANSVNGEKILYEIFPIEKVEEAQAMGTTTTNPSVAQPTPNVNNNNSTLNSNRTTESLSTRSILTNALEGVAQNEWEQNKLNEYKENIAKVEEMESRLQEINSQLYPYGKKMPQKERIALRDEAVGLRNKITNIDKKLLRLEATKPLQNVLNRERARVRREMKQKADERISEVKAEAAQRLKRRSEGHAATEMRKKIRKTIRELDKILNRGDKKRLDSKPLFIFSFTHRFIEIFFFSQYTVFQR